VSHGDEVGERILEDWVSFYIERSKGGFIRERILEDL